MATFPALTINSTNLNITELYDESLHDPSQNNPTTLDMLQGGLNSDNFTSAPPWACQRGIFVRGYFRPFTEWEFIYASQLDHAGSETGAQDSLRLTTAMLTTRLFIPWDCSAIVVGWQAMFRHDATMASYSGTSSNESWAVYFNAGASAFPSYKIILPPTRFESSGTSLDDAFETAGWANENRWLWSSNTMVLDSGTYADECSKGYLTLRAKVSVDIRADDPNKAKLLIPEGAIWALAFRD